MRLSLSALLLGLLLLGLTPANAWGQSGTTTPYTLGASTFERGCFGICDCAIYTSKLQGTFDLRQLPPSPLYSRYAVERVDWLANETSHSLRITGSGTYQVGGEVAVMERMTLDLSVDGGTPQHFDSGNVQGGGDFPRITISVRLHDASACTDTVIKIDAAPGVLGIDPRAALSPRAKPNPFTARTVVSFDLPASSQMDVSIHDLAGRLVRRLIQGERLGPGPVLRAWDGKSDEGAPAPAGMYCVRIQVDGHPSDLAVVKLR
jgi:hypothetical protein